MFVVRTNFEIAANMVKKYHYLGTLPKSVQINFAALDVGGVDAVACYGPVHAPRLPPGMLELRRLVKKPGSSLILSSFLAATVRILKREGVPALISWADPAAGHHGGIYQATNWVYSQPNSYNWNSHFKTENGVVVDHRTAFKMFGTSSKKKVLTLNPGWTSFLPDMKYRYILALNTDLKGLLSAMNARTMPYPKPSINGAGPKRTNYARPVKKFPWE